MSNDSMQDGIQKVGELIKDIRTAMLVTLTAGGQPRSRPMATQDSEFDGSLWFFTSAESRKVAEIARNPVVAVTYASSGKESYLSLTGRAEVLNDRARIEELWNPWLKAWFEGPDDPSLRLIRVEATEAEYWDTPGGKVASLLQIVRAVVTGDASDMEADNQTVRFP
jgi:general stress protein 26